MKSPLTIDQGVVSEFGITEDIDLPKMHKIAYVKAQIDEMKKMLFRERVDIILSTKLTENENEGLSTQGRTKLLEKRTNTRQFAQALEVLNGYLKELEAEK